MSTIESIAPIVPEIIKTKIVNLIASLLVGQVTFFNSLQINPADFDTEGLVLPDVTLLFEDIISSLYAKLFFYISDYYKT